jgi:hypothetical protein
MNRSIRLAFVAAVAALAGCEKKLDAPAPGGAGHEHHAPHKGALEVLGDEAAHVELVLDPANGRLSAYVLDGEAERAVRITQDALRLRVTDLPGGETTVELRAIENPLTGEKKGDTSQFEATSDKLKGVTAFHGTLETITVKGVKFDAVEVGYPEGNEHDEKPARAK